MQKICQSELLLAAMENIENYEKLGGLKKQLFDTTMHIQTVNFLSARHMDAIKCVDETETLWFNRRRNLDVIAVHCSHQMVLEEHTLDQQDLHYNQVGLILVVLTH